MSDPMTYEMLHDLGTQMYPWGRNYVHRGVFFDELDETVDELIAERTRAAPGEMDGIGVWSMGGRVGHGQPAAYAWPEKGYMVTVEANWEHDDNDAEFAWAHETERQLRELGGEGAYAGFTGVEEQEWEDSTEQVYADSYERLREIKAEYDPENVFRHNVNVDPAGD
jgi:FAD/FMN-containing dehydrogenase